ncbi:MAG: hypothetical protein ABIO04_13010 [Ferruginibacter sp.]
MKNIAYLALFSCLFLLQSCFEIIEQLSVNKVGSGNFQLVINMSKSRTKLNSIMKMKTVNGHKIPGKVEIEEKISEIEKRVKRTAGISNVKTSLDLENFIATISCQFTQVDDLNAAIKNTANNEKDRSAITDTYKFNATGASFSRMNKFLLKEEYQKLGNADKEIFSSANYTSIFRFDRPIMAASNPSSKLSADKKAVMLTLNALEIVTNRRSIENNVNLIK